MVENLVEMENGNSANWKRQVNRYLSISELIVLGNLLKDSTAVSDKELVFYVPDRLHPNLNNVMKQLAVTISK